MILFAVRQVIRPYQQNKVQVFKVFFTTKRMFYYDIHILLFVAYIYEYLYFHYIYLFVYL